MTTANELRLRPPSATELLDRRIDELSSRCKLDSWTSFIEPIKLPSEFYVAVMTGRPELIKVAHPRELSKDECAAIYQAFGTLIDTNMALREHAAELAGIVDNLKHMLRGLQSTFDKVIRFANFKNTENDDTD